MPGRVSLAKQQYYAHPRNAFWSILGELFDAGPELPYAQRKTILIRQGVAVWDVLQQCHRPGSLDGHIVRESEIANDLPQFLADQPRIRRILFNGQKAEGAFDKHCAAQLGERAARLTLLRVPSTSPAHAALTWQQKLAAWRQAVEG
jgi:hypoxanthine-DNA glycosylase